MSALTTVAALREARAVLGRNGWLQGSLYDYAQVNEGVGVEACRVCLVGALRLGATGSPQGGGDAFDAAYDAVFEILSESPGPEGWAVANWNDAEGRTLDEVYTLLDEAIERAEAGAL